MYVVIGYGLSRVSHLVIGQGIFSFFIGGLTFQLFGHLWSRGWHRRVLPGLVVLTALMWILIPLNLRYDWLGRLAHQPWSFHLFGKDVVGFALQEFSGHTFELLLFPLTILTLALAEAWRGTLGKRLAFLGDISYSSYLWHFPLQLAFVGAASLCALPATWFCGPWSLFLYFLILIPISLGSYRFIERPCQSWLRARLLRPAAGKIHSGLSSP
jgi:peptidoglycan/LPS O-acetylase OafA/YrhL